KPGPEARRARCRFRHRAALHDPGAAGTLRHAPCPWPCLPASPMQYRHAFHAGNFADVHKHIALLQLIESLKKKAKGFLYLDTHAGEGLYDLGSSDARQGGESTAGIGRLESAVEAAPAALPGAISHYLDVVKRLRGAAGAARFYPGSPLLAAASLRDADAGLCVESEAPISRALQRALERCGVAGPRQRVVHGDGYRELRAHLPPPT